MKLTSGTVLATALFCWSPPSDAYSLVPNGPRKHRPHRKKSLGDERHSLPGPPVGITAATTAPVVEVRSVTPGLRRRVPVLSRIFGRRSLKLHGSASPVEERVSSVESTVATDDFIRRNLELLSPDTLFPMDFVMVTPPVAPLPEVDSTAFALPSAAPLRQQLGSAQAAVAPSIPARRRVSPLTRISRGWVENVLTGMFHRWSKGRHVNMDIKCDLKSSWRDLVRGDLRCDASIDVDSIVFNALRLSGGRLEAQRLTLNLFSFFPDSLSQRSPRKRYPSQFDLLAKNVTLTQYDLMQSPCIRNGLRRLLTRILNIRGMNAAFVKVEDITILPSGKLSCLGKATTIVGTQVPFEVRTGLGMNSRGHVLTLPGLELSLSPAFDFFVPILPDITVDLGHNAQLSAIRLDGQSATIQLSARVTITPDHTVHLPNYRQFGGSYSAPCSVDVGRWLTRLGRFNI